MLRFFNTLSLSQMNALYGSAVTNPTRQGKVLVGNQKVLMTLTEVLALQEECNKRPKLELDDKLFKSMFNGFVQGDGKVTAFLGDNSFKGNVGVDQLVSDEFFVFMNMLPEEMKVNANREFFVNKQGNREVSVGWCERDVILNVVLPYLDELYGYKYINGVVLAEMLKLSKVKTTESIVHQVALFYILQESDLSLRKTPILEYIKDKLDLDIQMKDLPNVSAYANLENSAEMNMFWVLGFFLAEGNIENTIKLVDSVNKDHTYQFLNFIQNVRLTQKTTELSLKLCKNISSCLKSHGIANNISNQVRDKHSDLLHVSISGIDWVEWFENNGVNKDFYFAKKSGYVLMHNILDIKSAKLSPFCPIHKEIYLYIVEMIYEQSELSRSPRKYTKSHWLEVIESISTSDFYHYSMDTKFIIDRGTSYRVFSNSKAFPIPSTSFTTKKCGSKEAARVAALQFRNQFFQSRWNDFLKKH